MNTLREADRAVLVEMSDRLREALGPDLVEVRLFGSRAEGTAQADSDYDILVLLRTADAAKGDLAARIVHATKGPDGRYLPVQPLVLTVDRFRRLRERELRIALDADRYGISL